MLIPWNQLRGTRSQIKLKELIPMADCVLTIFLLRFIVEKERGVENGQLRTLLAQSVCDDGRRRHLDRIGLRGLKGRMIGRN